MNTEIILTLRRTGTVRDLDPIVEALAAATKEYGYANDPDIDDDSTEIKSIINVRELFIDNEEDVQDWISLMAETSDIIVLPLTSPMKNTQEENQDE